MTAQKGFTIVELIMVMVIMSILLTIAIPQLMRWRDRMHLRDETLELVGFLYRAKSVAVKKNCFVVIRINDDNSYTSFLDNGKGADNRADGKRQPDEQQLFFKKMHPGITLSSTFKNNKVQFKGYSGISAGSFILSNANGEKVKVILNILGRIRISRS
jgi:prepilin-type N-terminal cleavage/methylation domain-containing protein